MQPKVEEQEAFHSNPYGFSIPYNIEDFDNKSNNNISKSSNLFKDNDVIIQILPDDTGGFKLSKFRKKII
ncbi:unnamed protein product [Rhizophagus irregularis]|nr:unnamed protein product [Rhizophagus irregularis]